MVTKALEHGEEKEQVRDGVVLVQFLGLEVAVSGPGRLAVEACDLAPFAVAMAADSARPDIRDGLVEAPREQAFLASLSVEEIAGHHTEKEPGMSGYWDVEGHEDQGGGSWEGSRFARRSDLEALVERLDGFVQERVAPGTGYFR